MNDVPDSSLEAISQANKVNFQSTVNSGATSKWAAALVGGVSVAAGLALVSLVSRKMNLRFGNLSGGEIAVGGGVSAVGSYEVVKVAQKTSQQALNALEIESILKDRALAENAKAPDAQAKDAEPEEVQHEAHENHPHQVSDSRHDGKLDSELSEHKEVSV